MDSEIIKYHIKSKGSYPINLNIFMNFQLDPLKIIYRIQ